MDQLQAIKELKKHDHCFLSPEGVEKIGEPFGVYQIIEAKDNRSDFKGLTLNNKEEGDMAKGLSSHTLAKMICEKLGIDYPQQHGIGSQLRVCCEAVEKHLSN